MTPTKLRIHTWPEKILRRKCKEIVTVDDTIRSLLGHMQALMQIADGVGLAGNQAGLDARLLVVADSDHMFRLVNPRILNREGSLVFTEGCLSFPGLALDIKRAAKITVEALNEEGETIHINADGILSVVFQHEIDHLNGIAFINRISLWQRLKIIPQLRRIAQGTKNRLEGK